MAIDKSTVVALLLLPCLLRRRHGPAAACSGGRRRQLLAIVPSFLGFGIIGSIAAAGLTTAAVDVRRRALGRRRWLVVHVDVEVEGERAGWLSPMTRHCLSPT